ncbi:hypothetical protein [uncultured Microbulbifer sp.]|uniref:hypothetical protein n=1 Tax=uncultured Microbulbifer sp. TaxID=348147 RepID=UPI00262CCACE|nr:hypothetical protein [uncultured Microbulbifer sp.]
MKNIVENLKKEEIESALIWYRVMKWVKVALAIILVWAYFADFRWLSEILYISVILLLFLPLGFFDTFISELLEYNTGAIEKRQLLNANEANEHFSAVFERVKSLEEQVESIELRIEDQNT